MKRGTRAVCLVAAAGLGVGAFAAPASADDTGSAFASAVQVETLGGGLTATSTSGGAAAFAQPSLQSESDQVVAAVTSWARQVPSRLSLLSGSEDGTALTPLTSQGLPGDVEAVPCDTWAAGACFDQSAGADDLSGELLVMPTPDAAGWTARDDTTTGARVNLTGAALDVFGASVLTVDQGTSSALCDPTSCSTTVIAAGTLGFGYGRFAVDQARGLTIDVGDGGAYVPVSDVPDGTFSLEDGRRVTISHHESTLTFDVDLTVGELFRATGLDQQLSQEDLANVDPSSTVELTVALGAPDATGATDGSAAAVELEIGLHADLVFSVGGGLSTVTTEVTGDLATLDLGRVVVAPVGSSSDDTTPTQTT